MVFGSNSPTMQTVGYSIFAAIFSVGWAATQVSHMSMVNCITLNPTSRVVLASCRNAFTMVANLSLYALALAVFNISKPRSSIDIKNQYRWIAYLSIFIGCCFVGIFLVGTKEPRLKQGIQGEVHLRISWAYWFKKALYYQVALLFVVSVILQEVAWTGKRLKAFFTVGGVLWILSSSGILILPSRMHAFMYLLSTTIGIANALMTVTCISMQSVVVGEDLNGCAFVYGSMSFLDKISCGVALFILESYQSPSSSLHSCYSILGCLSITRYGLGLFRACCSLLGVAVIYTMNLHTTKPKPITEPLLA